MCRWSGHMCGVLGTQVHACCAFRCRFVSFSSEPSATTN
jgi:hypothetical protein